MSEKIVQLEDHKRLEDIIEQRVGDEFVISFKNKENPGMVYTYVSKNLTNESLVYMAENLKMLAFGVE